MNGFRLQLGWMALACLGDAAVVSACPTCGSEDATLASAPAAAVRELDSVATADVSVGSDARGSGPTALERSDTRASAAVAIAPTAALSFAAQLHWIWRTARATGAAPLRTSGLGDAEIRGRWTARTDSGAVTLGLGATLPSAPLLRAANGTALDWRVQLGTGALEATASAAYEVHGERVAASASLTALWPTTGWLGAHPGRSVRGTFAAHEALGARVRLRLAIDLRWDEAWLVQGTLDPDNGTLYRVAVTFEP
jgi:hypothetical protein